MSRLYPPQIEGTLPAYCIDDPNSKGMAIPFIMNKTVGWGEIKGFYLKIKKIQNNETIMVLEKELATNEDKSIKDTNIVYFTNVDNTKLIVGNSYKVQLAYMYKENDQSLAGYYSTVGVIKCTTMPDVSIEGLQDAQLYSDSRVYTGYYKQYNMVDSKNTKDSSEKVYSYNFTIYDEQGNVLETSGEKLHNHENDEYVYESHDTYQMIKALEENKIYTIIYTVTTANGVVKASPRYRITQQSTVAPEISAKLVATMNEENGYVDLQLIGDKDEFGVEKVGTGKFLICRASSEDRFGSWSEVDRFVLYGEAPSAHKWKDFTVQHGFTYVYSLQQYNDYKIYSNRMLSNEIVANFEHSFLYDGKRQLKIKFNPKVTSFKETLLEQKTNTLGGKYPFFFRNANVKYKEFPISGLISYLSDEEQLFLTDDDLLLEDLSHLKREHTLKEGVKSTDYDYFNNMLDANNAYRLQAEYAKREMPNSQEKQIATKRDRTTILTDYNIVAERIFKMKVLEFLNDGQPKLFRSPGEGNYIVRLMNSSLSPDDKLSRMIHTFSTTATEIDDFNYQKLGEYQLISNSEPVVKQLRWATIDLRDFINKNGGPSNDYVSIGNDNNIMSVQFLDMIPGDKFAVKFAATDSMPLEIQIGMTGAYYMEFDEPVTQILIPKSATRGQVTYSYYGADLHHFETYAAIKMNDIPVIQLRGSTENVNKDIREAFSLEDIKHKITKYYFLNFVKDYDYTKSMDEELRALTEQYHNKEMNFDEYEIAKENIYKQYGSEGSLFKLWIDGKEIDITDTQDYQLIKPEHIPEIKLGVGVCLDISIQRREIEYGVEIDAMAGKGFSDLKTAIDEYNATYNAVQMLIKADQKDENGNSLDGKDQYLKYKYQPDPEKEPNKWEWHNPQQGVNYDEALHDALEDMKNKYKEYLSTLQSALNEKEAILE